ncbi:MAG TPA: hypothetical protein DEB25_05920, partial [Desulfobulbaceae bacterium]|nr:hypothetical protein [Desulfobulbaceae bacterium]
EPLTTCWGLTRADIDSLRQWTPDSGIRWGLDARHLATFAAPDGMTTTWEAGLARMTLGFAMGDGPSFHGIVPWSGVEGGDGRLLGRLHAFIALIRQTLYEFADDCPLRGWLNRFSQLLAALFPGLADGSDSGDELADLRQILAGLTVIPGNEHQEPVSLAVLTAWLRRQAEKPALGGFLRGRLTFCSMLPMRSIPFAGVFLLGLNDGDFPRRDTTPSFDLLRESFHLGDRSVRADDRYQFLEAMLAARRTLFLSYVGKSAKKGEDLPPSLVVTELLETLARDYSVHGLVVQHPLHPFDRRYFTSENSELFSYARQLMPKGDEDGAAAAVRDPWWRGEIAFTPPLVFLDDWLEFLTQPQRYFFRRRLGLDLREAAGRIAEQETFALNGLENWQAGREILTAIEEGEMEDETAARLAASGAWPLGGPGQALFQEKWRAMTAFAATVAGLDLGQPLPRRFFSVDCGLFHCQGTLSAGRERGLPLINHRKLRGKDLLQGWLYALLLQHLPDMQKDVILAFTDGVFRLRAAEGDSPTLADMARLFVSGSRAPSPLLPEPAFTWAKREASVSTRHKRSAASMAEEELQKALADSREPEWAKLFAHLDGPLWRPEHEAAARAFMLPVYARLRVV